MAALILMVVCGIGVAIFAISRRGPTWMLALPMAMIVATVGLFIAGAIEEEAWWFLALLAVFIAVNW
jgi:hypothetical protein